MQYAMRRRDRQVSLPDEIEGIMKKCRVCRLGLFDEAGPYIVPLNFGYAVREGNYTLYFHSAREGSKIEAIRQNPRVAFEMDCAVEVYAADAETPCTYSCRFESVMGEGRARLLETHADKAAGLNAIMRQQAGREFAFSEAMTAAVAVIAVEVEGLSAKRHE